RALGAARPASAAMIVATRPATQRRKAVTCCWKAAARARASGDRRGRGGAAALAGDDRRHPAAHPAAEGGHLLLEVGVEAEGLGEQQAEGVLVPVDEVDVGPEPAPQALLVVLGLAEGGLQLLGEPAQLAGQ